MKIIPVKLPKIGESTTEAKIVEWLKKPGDFIKKDELFAVIGTDKVDSEIFSEYEGTLTEILVHQGDEAKIGDAICTMEVAENVMISEDRKTEKPADETQNLHSVTIKTNRSSGTKFLSPLVRKIASEHNLSHEDLERFEGKGEHNRIRKQDIEEYLQSKSLKYQSSARQILPLKMEVGENLEPLSKMRQRIAENMENSWRNIPHVTTFMDVNVSRLVHHRNAIKQEFLDGKGLKITYTHFIMAAVIKAIKAYPQINSWFNNEKILPKRNINLGFATALPDGNLIVPNIKNAQEMEVEEIAKSVNEVAARAKTGKLLPDDITDTTFTVSNTGMFGSESGTPIIAQPQVAVLALGNILRRPWVMVENNEEKITVQEVMTLSLSYDHRIIDGALASRFLTEVRKNMENY